MSRPLVLGHRGASGYRPENTLGSIALAIELGADGLEIDVVPTRDGVLVVRHDAGLATTTDVAARPDLADRRRDGDWAVTDLDAAEVATLRSRERWPALRPASAAQDGEEGVPTLAQVLALTAAAGVLLVVEIKHAAGFAGLGLDPVPMLEGELDRAPALPPIVLESFERAPLDRLAQRGFPRVLLRDGPEVAAIDPPALAADGLAGVSVPVDGVDDLLVSRCHDAGLVVWAWTLRPEPAFQPSGASPWRERWAALMRTGVDAVFADHPDLAVEVRAGLSGAAAPSPRAR